MNKVDILISKDLKVHNCFNAGVCEKVLSNMAYPTVCDLFYNDGSDFCVVGSNIYQFLKKESPFIDMGLTLSISVLYASSIFLPPAIINEQT